MRGRARRGSTRCSRSARSWEVRATRDRRRSPTRGRLRVFDGDELVGDMPVDGAGRRLPALRPRARAAPAAPLYPAPPRDARRGRRPARRRCSRCSARRTSPAAGRCSSSTTRSSVAHGAPAGAGRRRGAAARARRRQRRAIAVSIDGNGRRVACDPYVGAAEAVLRVRRQPRLRRRRAARPHQLPQLRQPREAAHRLAAHARGRGHGRRLPRARRAGRRRQRLALQRGRRTGRSTRRRSSAWSASCPTRRARAGIGLRARGRRDRARRPVPPVAAGLGARASCAASAARRAAARSTSTTVRAGARASCARPCAPASCRAPTTSPRAAWPCARRRVRARRRRRRDARPRAAERRAGRRRAALFGEGPGGVVVSGPRDGAATLEPQAARIGFLALGEVGGDAVSRSAAGTASARRVGRGRGALRLWPAAGSRDATRRSTAPRGAPLGTTSFIEPELDARRTARRVRRLRRLRARSTTSPGSPTSRSTRSSTAARSRPGIATCDERPHHDPARPRPRLAGLRRAQAARARRRDGDRPRALLDHRLERLGELPAGLPLATAASVALAHNGNLINAVELHNELREQGVAFRSTSDSEIIAALLSTPPGRAHRGRGRRGDAAARGRVLDRGHDRATRVVAFRDPAGLRPLCLGQLDDRYVRRLRELRARHHRRQAHARGRSPASWSRSASAGSRRARWSSPTRARVLRLRAHLLLPPRLASSRAARCSPRAAGWARSSRARRRSTPTS